MANPDDRYLVDPKLPPHGLNVVSKPDDGPSMPTDVPCMVYLTNWGVSCSGRAIRETTPLILKYNRRVHGPECVDQHETIEVRVCQDHADVINREQRSGRSVRLTFMMVPADRSRMTWGTDLRGV